MLVVRRREDLTYAFSTSSWEQKKFEVGIIIGKVAHHIQFYIHLLKP